MTHTIVEIPSQELKSAKHIKLNSALNQSEIIVSRADSRLDEAVEKKLEGWDYTPSLVGLPDDATDEEIDAALRPLIRDWLWANLLDLVEDVMSDLDDYSYAFGEFRDTDVQAVRELRTKHEALETPCRF